MESRPDCWGKRGKAGRSTELPAPFPPARVRQPPPCGHGLQIQPAPSGPWLPAAAVICADTHLRLTFRRDRKPTLGKSELPLRKIEAPRNGIDLDINPDLLLHLPPHWLGRAAPPRKENLRPTPGRPTGLDWLATRPAHSSSHSLHACPQGLQPTSTASRPAPTISTSTRLHDLHTSPHNLATPLP